MLRFTVQTHMSVARQIALWALGVASVLMIVATVFSLNSTKNANSVIEYLDRHCCLTGWETSSIGDCKKGKSNLLARLQTGVGLPTSYEIFQDTTFAFIAILLGFIVVMTIITITLVEFLQSKRHDVEYSKSDRDIAALTRQTRNLNHVLTAGFVCAIAIGIVTIILTSLNHGYIAFQEWPEAWAAAGCCCCVPAGLAAGEPQTCNAYCDQSQLHMCNGTAQHCYSHTQLLQHGWGSLQPAIPSEKGWTDNTGITLSIVIVATVIFLISITLLNWCIGKGKTTKTKKSTSVNSQSHWSF